MPPYQTQPLPQIVVGFTILALGVAMLVLPGPGWVAIALTREQVIVASTGKVRVTPVGLRLARIVFIPLVAIGAASVGYWYRRWPGSSERT